MTKGVRGGRPAYAGNPLARQPAFALRAAPFLIAWIVFGLVLALGLFILGDLKTAAGCMMGAAVAGAVVLAWEWWS